MATATIILRNTMNHDRWVQVTLSLGGALPVGKLSFIREHFACNVIGLDQVASDDAKGWGILVLSGARYVFGTLGVPHTEIKVHSLTGRVDESDTSGISIASALCLMSLLSADISKIDLGNWEKIDSLPLN